MRLKGAPLRGRLDMEGEIANPPPPLLIGTLPSENCHFEGSAFQCIINNHGNDF